MNNFEILFSPDEKGVEKYIESINKFGNIFFTSNFKFEKCPNNINEQKKYTLSEKKGNIITKIGGNSWVGIKSVKINELDILGEFAWKIRILKSNSVSNYIMIGIAPIDFDTNLSSYNYGYYLYCYNSSLYSGPPYNYNGKETNLYRASSKRLPNRLQT